MSENYYQKMIEGLSSSEKAERDEGLRIFYKEYSARIISILRKVGGYSILLQDAEDILQDLCIRIYQKNGVKKIISMKALFINMY